MNDGAAEATAINGWLNALTGEFFEGALSDDDVVARNFRGSPTGYRVVSYSDPVPLFSGRGLGVSEAGQPYTMPFRIVHVASTPNAARLMSNATRAALLGKVPNSPNSGEVKSSGGVSYQIAATESKPTESRVVSYYEVYINGTVEEL